MKKSVTIKNITFSGILIALMIVLTQVMRIQIIPRTSIPLFLIPIFISPYIIKIKYSFLVGFLGHILSDLLMGWINQSSIFWNVATGLLAIIIYLCKNLRWFIALPIIIMSNILFYAPIDILLSWIGLWYVDFQQIILGVLITNPISIIIFYIIFTKIGKQLAKGIKNG